MAISEPSPTDPPGDPPAAPGPLLRLIRDQRVAFLIVGGINTSVAYAWFALFLHLLGPTIGYLGVLLVTHVVAVLCAFTLHRRFVFRVHGHVLLDLGRFELVNLGALAVNLVLLPLFVEVFGLAVLPAQLLATIVSIITTYVGHRAFSFRRRDPAGGRSP